MWGFITNTIIITITIIIAIIINLLHFGFEMVQNIKAVQNDWLTPKNVIKIKKKINKNEEQNNR